MPKLDSVSVRPAMAGAPAPGGLRSDPTHLVLHNTTLKALIRRAYDLADYQISGGPAWLDRTRWDVDAHASASVSQEQRMKLLRGVLAEQFQLTLHNESRNLMLNVLGLTKSGAKFGPHFHAVKAGAAADPVHSTPNGQLEFHAVTMTDFANRLWDHMQLFDPVVGAATLKSVIAIADRTGLHGAYDISLRLDQHNDWPEILEHQLGLTLQLRSIPVEVWTVDRASLPPFTPPK